MFSLVTYNMYYKVEIQKNRVHTFVSDWLYHMMDDAQVLKYNNDA